MKRKNSYFAGKCLGAETFFKSCAGSFEKLLKRLCRVISEALQKEGIKILEVQ
jgi:hypothetical protein